MKMMKYIFIRLCILRSILRLLFLTSCDINYQIHNSTKKFKFVILDLCVSHSYTQIKSIQSFLTYTNYFDVQMKRYAS